MGQSGVEPQELFKVGDIVRWKTEGLNEQQKNLIYLKIRYKIRGPFQVVRIIDENVEAIKGARGHAQLLEIKPVDTDHILRPHSGFWFEKVS